MKRIVRLLAIATLMFAGYACVMPNEEPLPPAELEVTPNNISGSWKLSQWSEGKLAEGTFVYIDFVRSEGTFTMYQNIDSHNTRTLTGRYHIYIDERLGCAVLRGEYDHGAGEWSHRYIVSSLTSQQMTLTVKDTPSEWCIYTRTPIPAEILGKE